MLTPRQRTILIAGPTASGKSALALALARALGGTIVNADSMQVYAELAILTARPTAEEEAELPHRLYGHVPAATAHSAGRWAEEVAAAIRAIEGEGRVPIVAGGTGLYFTALTRGLAAMPPIPAAIRNHWRAEAQHIPAERLHAMLATRDPLTAGRLQPSDAQRVVRALEVLEATARPLAEWQAEPRRPVIASDRWVGLLVAPAREVLRERIDRRFERMLAMGALDEVRRLRELDLDPALPAMRALGVPALLAHLAGERTLSAAIERAKAETRQYAKRQSTWFRHQLVGRWMEVDDEAMRDPARLLATL